MRVNLLLFSWFFVISTTIKAEIILDGSMGIAGSLIGPQFMIDAKLGQREGSNLFHSFANFNLNHTESATFIGPASIANIISRVTGSQVSQIDGLLSAKIPNASMYFINPAGIIFGPNAQIDLPGSLYISSADYLKLGDNGRFDASTPENTLLTVASPSAFGFLDATPAPISIEGSQLYLLDNTKLVQKINGADIPPDTLALIGGDLTINNGQLITFSNNVNLISVASKGEVPIMPMDFSDNAVSKYGTLSIVDTTTSRSAANIDTSSPIGGGEIFIRSGHFFLDNGLVFADSYGNKPGQDITIDITETLALTNASRITAEVYDLNEEIFGKANGDGGSIAIKAGDIQIMDGSQIASSTRSVGNAGNITILADTNMLVSGLDSAQFSSGVSSITLSSGQGGDVFIGADTLLMDTDAQLNAGTRGDGDAGNLAIQVKNLEMQSGALITVGSGDQLNFQGTGNGGTLNIEATEAILIKGESAIQQTALLSNTFTQGQGGKIKISAPVVTLENNGTIQALTTSNGNAGHISLDVDILNLHEGGKIQANTIAGSGLGGNIEIVANDLLEITGNETFITVATDSLGKGGNINIQAGKLQLANEGSISARSIASGNSGNINIQADKLQLTNGGGISARSTGSGNAGNIVIRLKDKLNIQEGSIQTATVGADGGDIVITAPNYVYLANGEITTSVGAKDGNGGNITLKPEFIIQDNGKIIARAISGDGGNIQIITKGIFKNSPQSASPIDASSQFGVDGVVAINSPDEDVFEDMVILPSTFSDLSKMLKSLCEAGQVKTSQFVVVNFAGSPPSPYDWKANRLLVTDFAKQAQSMTDKVGKKGTAPSQPNLLLASGCKSQ